MPGRVAAPPDPTQIRRDRTPRRRCSGSFSITHSCETSSSAPSRRLPVPRLRCGSLNSFAWFAKRAFSVARVRCWCGCRGVLSPLRPLREAERLFDFLATGRRIAVARVSGALFAPFTTSKGDRKRGDSGTDGSQTLPWREMDSNHRYRIRNNPFWLPPFGPAIRLPKQKPALSCRGPMVRIHLPPAERWYGAGGEGGGTIVAASN